MSAEKELQGWLAAEFLIWPQAESPVLKPIAAGELRIPVPR